MDKERQIRFLLPPFFLFASLLLGIHYSPGGVIGALNRTTLNFSLINIVALLAGGGVLILSLGYLIGTFSYLIMRLLFIFNRNKKIHEAAFDIDTLKAMISCMKIKDIDAPDKYRLYIAASFDHGFLPEGIHDWVTRRWNAFNASVSSGMAVLLSLPFGKTIFGIPLSRGWWIPSVVVAFMLFVTSFLAWRETNRMINFLATHSIIKPLNSNNCC